MSIKSRIIRILRAENRIIDNKTAAILRNVSNYAIIDIEVGLKDHKIHWSTQT